MKIVNVFAIIFPVVMLVANADYKSTIVGQSFYLPGNDILSPLLNGVHIFKKLDDSCFNWNKERRTFDEKLTYEDINSFYSQISSDSSLSLKLMGMYTMGTTVNVKTKSKSGGQIDIKGESINIKTYVEASSLNPDCLIYPTSQLRDEVINIFDSLTLPIEKPWLKESWQAYENFLITFGSHFVQTTKFGASVRQWTFSKAESQYSLNDLHIRACMDLAGPTEVGKLNVSYCSGITEADEKRVAHIDTSNYLDIYGGSDETRNRFRSTRSKADLDTLLNEGRAMKSPISYEYIPIWNILMNKFYDNPERHARAMNLMHYYHGFADFGCSHVESGHFELRAFKYSQDSKPMMPVFQCNLINEGCQKDSDCKTDFLTVTYCYGSSCFVYDTLALGFKAKSVSARTSQTGHYDKGINLCCYFDAFDARCHKNMFNEDVIWSGEALTQKAIQRKAVLELKMPASQNALHSEL